MQSPDVGSHATMLHSASGVEAAVLCGSHACAARADGARLTKIGGSARLPLLRRIVDGGACLRRLVARRLRASGRRHPAIVRWASTHVRSCTCLSSCRTDRRRTRHRRSGRRRTCRPRLGTCPCCTRLWARALRLDRRAIHRARAHAGGRRAGRARRRRSGRSSRRARRRAAALPVVPVCFAHDSTSIAAHAARRSAAMTIVCPKLGCVISLSPAPKVDRTRHAPSKRRRRCDRVYTGLRSVSSCAGDLLHDATWVARRRPRRICCSRRGRRSLHGLQRRCEKHGNGREHGQERERLEHVRPDGGADERLRNGWRFIDVDRVHDEHRRRRRGARRADESMRHAMRIGRALRRRPQGHRRQLRRPSRRELHVRARSSRAASKADVISTYARLLPGTQICTELGKWGP